MCAAITVTLVSTGYLFQNLLVAALRWAWRTLLWLLPDTMLAWGVVAIAVAFGLLAVGTYLSLKRTAAPTAPPPDPVL
jgi:hypothetical protein